MNAITLNRTELGSALAFAMLAVPKRPAVPVLAGMRVSVSCGTLEFGAFGYELTARVKVAGEATGPAEILVNAAELSAAVKSLPKRGKTLTARVSIDADAITIMCDGVESTVPAMPGDAAKEYPEFPVMPALAGVADAESFAVSVARVAACAGTDVTLPVLTHVQVTSDSSALILTATDRYRLVVDRVYWTGEGEVSLLLPAVTLAKFGAACDRSGKVSVHQGDGFTGLTDGVRTMIMRGMDPAVYAFPRVKALIRPACDDVTVLTVDAAALAAAATRAGKITEKNGRTALEITSAGATVRAMRDGNAAAAQLVPAQLTGPRLETGFCAGYLASVLAGVKGTVRIGFLDRVRPAVVRAGEFTALVMPIRPPVASMAMGGRVAAVLEDLAAGCGGPEDIAAELAAAGCADVAAWITRQACLTAGQQEVHVTAGQVRVTGNNGTVLADSVPVPELVAAYITEYVS